MDYIMGLSCADNLTHVNIASISGVVVQSFTVGAINFFFANEQEISQNFAEAFLTAHMAGYPVRSCRQICMGVAGFSKNQLTTMRLDPVLRDVMRRCGYMGDAWLLAQEEVALYGALRSKKGAILLANNASVCYGKNAAGLTHRTGGVGVLDDSDGSAYAVGREILRALAHSADGRTGTTYLTTQVYLRLRISSISDLSEQLHSGKLSTEDICDLASFLPQACQMQDKVALEISSKIAHQLFVLVQPVIKRLGLQKETLAIVGSILLNNSYVGNAFKDHITNIFPDLKCVPPQSDGAAGAVYLAKERLALRGYR